MSNMHTATLFEYQRYSYQISTENYLEDKTLYLTENTLKLLVDLNDSKRFMEFGLNTLKPLNYVGVVRVNEFSIQIFPKLYKDKNYQDQIPLVAGNLLKMLSCSGNISIKEIDIAGLDTKNIDLFEIFIKFFAKQLLQVIKFSQKREYIKKSDEIRVVKGRIDFKKYNNPCRMHIIPCNFHEFSSDNTLNRTLKFTCYLMARRINDFSTKRDLRSIIDILDQVTLTHISGAEIENIPFSRLNQIFKPFIDMCRVFLSGSTLTMQASDVESFSLLIPMERLFEQFITRVLKEKPSFFFRENIAVRSQHPIGAIARDENNKKLFKLKPDICIGDPNDAKQIEAIIDLKYKELDEADSGLGVSQSDIYQIYTYATKTNTEKCMLLYPDVMLDQEKNLTICVPSKERKERDVLLFIRAIRLSYDLNKEADWEEFRNKLRDVVRPLLQEQAALGIESSFTAKAG
jgi:5-methylcytosine-specific restriction enzyme subunit McrC